MKLSLIAVLSLLLQATGCAGPAFTEDQSSSSQSGKSFRGGSGNKSGDHGGGSGGGASSVGTSVGLSFGGTTQKDAPSCEYSGVVYQIDEVIKNAPEECNECKCTLSGIACGNERCSGRCSRDGKTYTKGETFLAGDTCNECSCAPTGYITCTNKTCLPTCKVDGETYREGDIVPSGLTCKDCRCTASGVECSIDTGCCHPTTESNKKYLLEGESCNLLDVTACPGQSLPFKNACGCGCAQSSSCPPPSPTSSTKPATSNTQEQDSSSAESGGAGGAGGTGGASSSMGDLGGGGSSSAEGGGSSSAGTAGATSDLLCPFS